MKNIFIKTIIMVFVTAFSALGAHAVQFDVLVVPTEIFKVCDNYFCFPESSEILADYLIKDLNAYGTIKSPALSDVRAKLYENEALKASTETMLRDYKQSEKIDFDVLDKLSAVFNVKSVILVSSYTLNDKSDLKRDLWDILEISSAFKTTYPFSLVTSVVLTDTVNNTVMWSSKFSRSVCNNNGNFSASNQAQAASHLEKIKYYYKNFVAESVAQNVHLRFFPKDVKTFSVKKTDTPDEPKFVPNALEHLIKPTMIKELDDGAENTYDSADDFIFAF